MATEGILGCVSLLKSKIRSKIWMIRIFLEKRHGIKKRDYFSHNIEGILEKKKTRPMLQVSVLFWAREDD